MRTILLSYYHEAISKIFVELEIKNMLIHGHEMCSKTEKV